METNEQMIAELESFLESFKQYAVEVYREHRNAADLEALASDLRRLEPKITDMILKILGNGEFETRVPFETRGRVVTYRDLLGNALIGGNNAMPYNFSYSEAAAIHVVDKAIGTLQAGLWPPKTPTPILIIRDALLRERCSDLLSAPGNYDRVIREATTVLEDRIRGKLDHATLSRLIPNSADQVGENLINELFKPDKPVVSISADKSKRAAFFNLLKGVFQFLRNPYHHKLDPQTEWSWAWSTVGFVDRLLADIDSCILAEGYG